MGRAVSHSNEVGLPERVRALLGELARRMGSSGEALGLQADAATADGATATWVDARVPEWVARGDWSDGPIPISALVLDSSGEMAGTVHVWVEAGALTAIEQGWVTDFAPTEWPTLDRLLWT